MEIPDNYPDKLSTDKLIEVISSCFEISVKATKKNSNYRLGPAYYNSMAELGQIELNKRIQQDLLDLIEKQRKDNKMSGGINKILAIITIVLAITTIYFGRETLSFAQIDEQSGNKWKAEQIELLKTTNSELKNISKYLMQPENQSSELNKTLHTTKNIMHLADSAKYEDNSN